MKRKTLTRKLHPRANPSPKSQHTRRKTLTRKKSVLMTKRTTNELLLSMPTDHPNTESYSGYTFCSEEDFAWNKDMLREVEAAIWLIRSHFMS
jgi:hypothetical protein